MRIEALISVVVSSLLPHGGRRDGGSGFIAPPSAIARLRTTVLFVSLLLGSLIVASAAPGGSPHWSTHLPRYWPKYVRPKTVLLAVRPQNPEEYLTLLTLSGLAARAAQQDRTDQMIWVAQQTPNAYEYWLADMLKQTGAKAKGPYTTAQLLRRFADAGIVKGYIAYRTDGSRRDLHQGVPADASANVATSLCAPLSGVAIADSLLPTYGSLRLKQLFDARGVSEEDCFDKYRALFNRKIVGMQDPQVPEVRDAIVAARAFVLSRPNALYEKVLAWADADSPVLGWGIGDEFDITSRATRHGLFMTDTDWCTNLPLLSTETPGAGYSAARLRNPYTKSIWDLKWEDNVHYATFIMSDGDNVQWNMGDFARSTEHSWWDSPYRGKMPIGWTSCYDNLIQLSPYTQARLFRTATPNDDFIVFGGGYFYPDLFGAQRPGVPVLAKHAAEVAANMRFGGMRLLMFNSRQWDCKAASNAYATFARADPDLLGIFAISYAPYNAGQGRVLWAPGGAGGSTPVDSVRFALWNHASDPGQGDPAKIASLLNAMPRIGTSVDDRCFSAVIIHAWSWFGAPHEGRPPFEIDQARGGEPGTGRGACIAKWCADLLQPSVRVVTPTDYILTMRLRLRPKKTLRSELSALERELNAGTGRATEATRTPARIELAAAWRSLRSGAYREAFEHGKRVFVLSAETAGTRTRSTRVKGRA